MATHFIYRSAYETPLGRRIIHFPDDSLLDWFRRHWADESVLPRQTEEADRDRAYRRTQEVFGDSVYGFGDVWLQMRERGAPPSTETRLGRQHRSGFVGTQPARQTGGIRLGQEASSRADQLE